MRINTIGNRNKKIKKNEYCKANNLSLSAMYRAKRRLSRKESEKKCSKSEINFIEYNPEIIKQNEIEFILSSGLTIKVRG